MISPYANPRIQCAWLIPNILKNIQDGRTNFNKTYIPRYQMRFNYLGGNSKPHQMTLNFVCSNPRKHGKQRIYTADCCGNPAYLVYLSKHQIEKMLTHDADTKKLFSRILGNRWYVLYKRFKFKSISSFVRALIASEIKETRGNKPLITKGTWVGSTVIRESLKEIRYWSPNLHVYGVDLSDFLI